ncbi:MAG: DUF4268 domain-containing protein [Chitinispirillales bacterium]|jgi:hypothetical protein|nr:DUF4268 domain-containing protein [Chitinispirillales bacterium]
MGSGKVYVVHNDWIKDPINSKMPYKIGKTTADSVVDGRFHGIGLIMPGKFVCDFAYEFDGEQYSEIEEMLHDLLDDSKVNGEWYWVNERVLKGIRRTCEKFGGRPITEEVTNEFAGEKNLGGEPPKRLSSAKSLQKEYWTYLVDYFDQHGTSLKLNGKGATRKPWLWIGAFRRGGFGITLSMDDESHKIWCSLYISAHGIKGVVNAKKAFFKLMEEKQIIEKEIGTKLEWNENDDPDDPDCQDSSISISRHGNIEDREQWEEFTKWFKKYAELFYKTFSNRVKNLEI